MTTYTVNYFDPKTAAETPIGQIAYEDAGRLAFVSALPSHEAYLRELVDRINQLPQLTERVDPGPDAPRFTVTTRRVPRYSPEFRNVLKAYLRRLYQLTLTTTEPEEPDELIAPADQPSESPEVPQSPAPVDPGPADASLVLRTETAPEEEAASGENRFSVRKEETAEEPEPEVQELPEPPGPTPRSKSVFSKRGER